MPTDQHENFDPYRKWLGIPPEEQPANHYRLLGVSLYEFDPEVIEAAADQRMMYVQQNATGRYLKHSQKLLNELTAARICLLNPTNKADYDQRLQKQLDGKQGAHFSDKSEETLNSKLFDFIDSKSASTRVKPVKRRLGPIPFVVYTLVAIGLAIVAYFAATKQVPELIIVKRSPARPGSPSDGKDGGSYVRFAVRPADEAVPTNPVLNKDGEPHSAKQPGVQGDDHAKSVRLASSPKAQPVRSKQLRPSDAVEFRGKHYKVFEDEVTWLVARARCERLGGHLATVNSAEENKFLCDLVRKTGVHEVWLGATDQKREGEWIWVTNQKMDFQVWGPGQPSYSGSGEPYLILIVDLPSHRRFHGKWCNQPNTTAALHHPGYVCQWD